LVGSVVELGAKAGVPIPTISAVYQAAKLLASTMKMGNIAVRGVELTR